MKLVSNICTCSCRTMRRSGYDYPSKHPTGSDYYSHVNRMARAPSVLTDVPHGHALFNNKPVQLNEAHRGGHYRGQPHQHNPEPVRSVVEVTETAAVAQCDRNNGNVLVIKERIDVQADAHKRKGFDLFKWRPFKSR